MPWLVKPKPDQGLIDGPLKRDLDEPLTQDTKGQESTMNGMLFVHVPRCGGTSLTKHFEVSSQALKDRGCFFKLGLLYFFYRYRLLETANYPYMTWENLYAVTSLCTATTVYVWGQYHDYESIPSYVMWGTAALTMLCSTFVFVAPVIGRNTCMRRVYAVLVGKFLCGWTASISWLTGCNEKAWLIHMTADKILRYNYVPRDVWDSVHTFAIVRNPYSRMVSIYMYNRMGPAEQFKPFVKAWYQALAPYRQRGSTEEWDVYCHALPEHEYTHKGREQLVQCVVRQEDLSSLTKPVRHPSFSHLPPSLIQALEDMPHTNVRTAQKPWSDYFDQETRDLVLNMYGRDFIQYGYDTSIPNRPDLGRPPLPEDACKNVPPALANKLHPVDAPGNRLFLAANLERKAFLPGGLSFPSSGSGVAAALVSPVAKEPQLLSGTPITIMDKAQPLSDENDVHVHVSNEDVRARYSGHSFQHDADIDGVADDADEDGAEKSVYILPEQMERRKSLLSRTGSIVPQGEVTTSAVFCETVFAPVRCIAPLEAMGTVEDLLQVLALTLRRRAIFLTFTLLLELAFDFYRLRRRKGFIYCNPKTGKHCFQFAIVTIDLSLHFVMVPLAWIAYVNFRKLTMASLCVWSYICSLWAAAMFALFTFDIFQPFLGDDMQGLGDTVATLLLVFAFLYFVYFLVFGIFYMRVWTAITKLESDPDKTRTRLPSTVRAYVF